MAEDKRQFPTEVIDLPSKGHFYPKDNPLSSGQVEIKYMTAREEDILTSSNLIQKGIVMDKLMEALVVSDINLDDVLIGDKNAIFIASRVLAYGKEYTFEYMDPSSGERRNETVDLTKFEHKELDWSKFEKGKNEHIFKLPVCKKTITFKLLSQHEERQIESELKAMRKFTKDSGIDPEVTTRLKASIVSIDGNNDRTTINNFIDNEFLAVDSLSYRKYLGSITPDVDMTFSVELDNGDFEEVAVPVTATFFWPSTIG